jgi:integral membrane protein
MLIRAFRWVAVIEAISWLVLIVATIVKYAAHSPGAVKVMGPIHGTLFIIYILLAVALRSKLRWDLRNFLTVLVESVIPGGGFLVIRRRDLAQQPATSAP